MSQPEPGLSEPWTMAFPYTRTTGPVVGRFLAGLRARRVLGLRDRSGRVHVPPTGYGPDAHTLDDWVEVSDHGTVVSFAWVPAPLPTHPCKSPFAWVLVRLDGADTALVHVLTGAREDELHVGMRVQASWAEERRGHITDIARFEPTRARTEREAPSPAALPPATSTTFVEPLALHYRVSAGLALSEHLRALAEGRFVGRRCPRCSKVYVPPLGACSTCSIATTDSVELPSVGTVTTTCIVNLPVRGQDLPLPFACANVLLDGADTPFLVLLGECAPHEARRGLRVEAVWRERAELRPSLDSVRYFRPTGEPDRDPDRAARAHGGARA